MLDTQSPTNSKSLYENIWQCQLNNIQDSLTHYIDGLEEDEEILQEKVSAASPQEWESENNARLFDFTCHPSQTNVPLRTAMANVRTRLRNLWREQNHSVDNSEQLRDELKKLIPDLLQEIRDHLFRDWHHSSNQHCTNFIPAINSISAIDLAGIIDLIKKGNNPQDIVNTLINQQSCAQDGLIDEIAEVTESAKSWLLNGNAVYTTWLDYDGAKRPAGLGYAIFATLLMIDIGRSYKSSTVPQSTIDIHEDLKKIDLAIHGLSLAMAEEENIEDYQKQKAIMRLLKQKRFTQLQTLVHLHNDISLRLGKDNDIKEISLSRRIRFAIRIDSKTADAAILKATNDPNLSQDDQDLLESICQQIKELNELSSDDYLSNGQSLHRIYQPICAQVMIANAGVEPIDLEADNIRRAAEKTVERMKAIRAELNVLEIYRQITSRSRINTTKYTLVVPLFESAKTITPQFITAYLNALWHKIERDPCLSEEQDNHQRCVFFQRRYSELFFAGSDSSRVIGSYAARVNVAHTVHSAHLWAQEHGIKLSIKFGVGESAFRQGGNFDVNGGCAIYDASTIEKNKHLWREVFGDEWWAITKENMGFEFTLKKINGINSFTAQARANEEVNTLLTPHQIRQKIKKLYDARASSQSRKFEAVDYIQLNAAANGSSSYTDLMGNLETSKPNGLVSYPALIEYLVASGFFPILRSRELSRQTRLAEDEKLAFIKDMGGINSRAIAVTHASNVLFPISLIEKSDILDKLDNDGQRSKVFSMIEIEALLREMLLFSSIQKSFFAILDDHEVWHKTSIELRRRWNALEKHIPLLRKLYLQQILDDDTYSRFSMSSKSQQIIDSMTPRVRELLSDDFRSDYAQCYMTGWQEIKPFLSLVIAYLAAEENKDAESKNLKKQIDGYILRHKTSSNIALACIATAFGYIG